MGKIAEMRELSKWLQGENMDEEALNAYNTMDEDKRVTFKLLGEQLLKAADILEPFFKDVGDKLQKKYVPWQYVLYYPEMMNETEEYNPKSIRFGALCLMQDYGNGKCLLCDVFSKNTCITGKENVMAVTPKAEKDITLVKAAIREDSFSGYFETNNGMRFGYFDIDNDIFSLTENGTQMSIEERKWEQAKIKQEIDMLFCQVPRMNYAFAELIAKQFVMKFSVYTSTERDYPTEWNSKKEGEYDRYSMGNGNLLELTLSHDRISDNFKVSVFLNGQAYASANFKNGSANNSGEDVVKKIADKICYAMRDIEYDMTRSLPFAENFFYKNVALDKIARKLHKICRNKNCNVLTGGGGIPFIEKLIKALDANGIYKNLFESLDDSELALLSECDLIPIPSEKFGEYRKFLGSLSDLSNKS